MLTADGHHPIFDKTEKEFPGNLLLFGDLGKVVESRIESLSLSFGITLDELKGVAYPYPRDIKVNVGINFKEEATRHLQGVVAEFWKSLNPPSDRFRDYGEEHLKVLTNSLEEAVRNHSKESRIKVVHLPLVQGSKNSRTLVEVWKRLLKKRIKS